VFHIDTKDEIVVDTAAGGRNTFKNASRTTRNGAELSWAAKTLETLNLLAAARLRRCALPEISRAAAGQHPAGVPRRTFYGEARWRRSTRFHTALELRYGDRIYTTDANAESAPPYSVVNWRIVFEQRASDWRISEFLRIENLFDKQYVGSVIVGDTNLRFYEPAPRRNGIVGINAVSRF